MMTKIIHLLTPFYSTPLPTPCGRQGVMVHSDPRRVTCPTCLVPRRRRGSGSARKNETLCLP